MTPSPAEKLARRIRKEWDKGPCPCDGCPHFDDCKVNLKACSAFVAYVDAGVDLRHDRSKDIFDELREGEE